MEMALSQSKRDFVISPLKGNLHSTHTCRQTKTHVVKQSSQSQSSIFTELYSVSEKVTPLFTSLSIFFSSPSSPFLSFHAALFSYPSFFPLSGLFSVQQCPSEHEDPATKPDGIDGELGTPSDSLPPTYHQLHGLLQLGET